MLNRLAVAASFILALASGSAQFYVTVKGKKYGVLLQKNDAPTAPNFSAITQLSGAVVSLALAGQASGQIKIGASNWSITLS